VDRRARGEPIAYLRGRVEWYDLDLIVTRDVLIPRPETEVLLKTAVQIGRSLRVQTVADVGTGCGAVAIGLARALPGVHVFAIDVSEAALKVARENIERYELEDRVTTLRGSLLAPLDSRPDLMTANLPYLTDEDMENLHRDVAHEPRVALAGGSCGLGVYEELIEQMRVRDWVMPTVLEIDPGQAGAIGALIRKTLPGTQVRILPGYAGYDRLVVICPPGRLPR
jgi:release factor glutamine methyltransferase